MLVICGAVSGAQEKSAQTIVESYIAAYNAHDVDGLLVLVTQDVRWMSVDGVRIRLESLGKALLGERVAAYFANLPSARSNIRSIDAAGNFVTVMEEATWAADGTTQSQCAVSVYQVSDGLISSVWYYPAQPCDAPTEE